MKKLNLQEQAFMALYLESFNATRAALDAGYSANVAKNHAWAWVSITGCPRNKVHLFDAIQTVLDARLGAVDVDAEWVIKRAKLLADFNIRRFIITTESGDAVYDFSKATGDDWYCIEEYTTDQSMRKISGMQVPVDKLKIKTPSKIAALKLLGECINMFTQKVEHSGAVTVELTRTVVD